MYRSFTLARCCRLRESIVAVVSVCKTRSQPLFKRLRVAKAKSTCQACQASSQVLASLGQRMNRLARANQALAQDRVAGEDSGLKF